MEATGTGYLILTKKEGCWTRMTSMWTTGHRALADVMGRKGAGRDRPDNVQRNAKAVEKNACGRVAIRHLEIDYAGRTA